MIRCVKMVVRQGCGRIGSSVVAHDVVDCGEGRVGLTFKGV